MNLEEEGARMHSAIDVVSRIIAKENEREW